MFQSETKYAALVVQAGEHTLVLEWRKWGSYIRAWRNSPSFLDGFAMSRFLVAMGERLDVASQHFLTPVVLKDPLSEWHTVGGRQLEFYLHGPATALFTYGLPVTQASLYIPCFADMAHANGPYIPPQSGGGKESPPKRSKHIGDRCTPRFFLYRVITTPLTVRPSNL